MQIIKTPRRASLSAAELRYAPPPPPSTRTMSLHSMMITLVNVRWYQYVSRFEWNLGIFARRRRDGCNAIQELGSAKCSGRDRKSCAVRQQVKC